MVNASTSTRIYKNLQLSYRGAERQPPSVLQLALQFSKVMSDHAETGKHDSKMSTAQRLKAVIAAFHSSEGVISKWAIDDEKEKAILNLLVGTCDASRQVIMNHLNFVKWRESAFTSELLKSSRWMINATPKGAKEPFKQLLVVTPEVQESFLKNHVYHFNLATRRMKASAKAKARPSVQEWDAVCSYTCIMNAVQIEMLDYFKGAADQEIAKTALDQLETCFMARMDETAWARYKHSLAKKAERDHIVSVQHGKSQNVIGKGSLNPSFGKSFKLRLHRNSERPALYNGWICVPDAFLPLKGTAHRAIKDAEAVKPSHINAFTDSELWRLQGLPVDNLPSAIPESEFNVPSARAHLSGNDARRNLTDAQETAQWVAGPCFTEKMLASQFPKYEPTPTSTAETPAAVPELQICKINNGQLHLPPDVRAQFMGDPVRSAEWKRLLAEFDRKWSTSSSGESGRSTDAAVEQIVAAEGDGDGESGQQDEEPRGSSWESAFVGEPTTKEDMEAKYTTAHSFPMADNLVGVIVEGPKLFVSSLGDVQWSVDEPFLCFGAGTWLLDDKAASYLEAWRLRMYPTEKVLGPAKPLLFLREALSLAEGQEKSTGSPRKELVFDGDSQETLELPGLGDTDLDSESTPAKTAAKGPEEDVESQWRLLKKSPPSSEEKVNENKGKVETSTGKDLAEKKTNEIEEPKNTTRTDKENKDNQEKAETSTTGQDLAEKKTNEIEEPKNTTRTDKENKDNQEKAETSTVQDLAEKKTNEIEEPQKTTRTDKENKEKAETSTEKKEKAETSTVQDLAEKKKKESEGQENKDSKKRKITEPEEEQPAPMVPDKAEVVAEVPSTTVEITEIQEPETSAVVEIDMQIQEPETSAVVEREPEIQEPETSAVVEREPEIQEPETSTKTQIQEPETSAVEVKERKGKQTPEEKAEVHRAASKRWHDKWIRKGVPRTEDANKTSASSAKKQRKQRKGKKNKNDKKDKGGKTNPKVNKRKSDSKQGSSAKKPKVEKVSKEIISG
eukprot:symbB.v1.2.011016.t1/scaffold726.1/size168711/2